MRRGVAVMETPALTVAGGTRQFMDEAVASGAVAGSTRRIPVVHNGDEVSLTPLSEPSPAVGVIRSIELAQAQPGETVTVHTSDFEDVRNRAQQLATRCGGRVVVPQSKDAPEQILFVELPQEYVAAFKLELLKPPVVVHSAGQEWKHRASQVQRTQPFP